MGHRDHGPAITLQYCILKVPLFAENQMSCTDLSADGKNEGGWCTFSSLCLPRSEARLWNTVTLQNCYQTYTAETIFYIYSCVVFYRRSHSLSSRHFVSIDGRCYYLHCSRPMHTSEIGCLASISAKGILNAFVDLLNVNYNTCQ